jgi:7-carboxy-7-deazaguanine synthase
VSYSVKEIFLTLQGEGGQAGRVAVFCRFAGCNLWSGREEDRASAACRFCDTDFVGLDGTLGGRYADAPALARAMADLWPAGEAHNAERSVFSYDGFSLARPFGSSRELGRMLGNRPEVPTSLGNPMLCVLTGGEPLLQVDEALVRALHDAGFSIALETNGTLPAPAGIDWICVSPKGSNALAQTRGEELKLVYPQLGAPPEAFAHLDFARFALQPMDGPDVAENTRAAIAYCLAHPKWRLSVQTHKSLGIR